MTARLRPSRVPLLRRLLRLADDARIEGAWAAETWWLCRVKARHATKLATSPYCYRCGERVYLQTGDL